MEEQKITEESVMRALIKARNEAYRLAKFHNLKIPVYQDGKVKFIDPDVVLKNEDMKKN